MEEAVARETAAFLREADERPFCAWASFVNPHPPLFPPDEFHDLFEGRAIPLRGDLATGGEGLLPVHAERRVKQGLDQLGADELLGITRAYYASLAWTDHCVGRVLDELERAGRADDTLVIYTSDHGEMLGQHGLLKKLTFYEGAVRVPLVLRWPGVVRPGTLAPVVQHVDLVPTLLELLGAGPYDGEDPLPGRSLTPLLVAGEDPGREDLAIAELAGGGELHWMLRDGRHKLAWYGQHGHALYDLREDPGETRDLSGDEEGARLVEELTARFDQATAGTTWRIPR
jgi:choline-sulfatase